MAADGFDIARWRGGLDGHAIGIVAPGGYAPDPTAVAVAVDRLRALGARVKLFCAPHERNERFSAPDGARARALHDAFADPDVSLVLALRGGYGATRLLPLLNFERLQQNRKLLIGHSDITALQLALLAKAGMPSLSGPMICDDFTRDMPSRFMLDHFLGLLRGGHAVEFAAAGSAPMEAEGMLWGGNLAMLTHLAGTPYFPQVEGGILFVEDVNEHPYRVERMLLQLMHAGVLQRQKALLLGDFSLYRLSDYDNGYDFDAMLRHLRSSLAIPVLTGLPFGHIRDKASLPVGVKARLVSDRSKTRLSFPGFSVPAASAER
ncbi:muramoyltetrapeptide carboxypeptidase [Noviherbaspirillum humi]|uniref:Muramoyltetrapeptide carboxypeptidase n=1 Tax=Noviherbaspirillum humi TaxID=1688639 RepID=A0A239HBL4_9BURK|nr:LD-carboxypeptidase [Noviherbaspirillum humi]SNS77654.1 muramoyltetrapeptide carboxypeptidase [Noviherbaspirillum humi]